MGERKITTAIFDVGGVLINQHPDAQNKAIMAKAGLHTLGEQKRYMIYGMDRGFQSNIIVEELSILTLY